MPGGRRDKTFSGVDGETKKGGSRATFTLKKRDY